MGCPKVSIIVPVYNVEAYLIRCVDSLRKQTLTDIEIILVDDGSPDNSPALCDKLAKEDARIKVIHKQNAGLGMARNTGIEAATGTYIGFVDSDDFVDTEMYEVLCRAAETNDAELVLSGMRFVGGIMFGKESEYTEKTCFSAETLFSSQEDIRDLRLGIAGALPHEPEDSRYGASVCKNLFKREILEKFSIRFLSERKILSEDTLFMLDYASRIQKAVGIPGVYYNYWRNENSLSKSYNPERLEKSILFVKEVEKRLMTDIPSEVYQIYLDRLLQAFGRVLCAQEIVYAVAHTMPYTALKERLRGICTQPEIADALKRYPWYKLPFKQAAFAFSVRYKLYRLQKLLVTLRNT